MTKITFYNVIQRFTKNIITNFIGTKSFQLNYAVIQYFSDTLLYTVYCGSL